MIKKVWSRLDRISMDKEFLKVSQGISECSFERLRGVPGRINGSFRSIFSFLFRVSSKKVFMGTTGDASFISMMFHK